MTCRLRRLTAVRHLWHAIRPPPLEAEAVSRGGGRAGRFTRRWRFCCMGSGQWSWRRPPHRRNRRSLLCRWSLPSGLLRRANCCYLAMSRPSRKLPFLRGRTAMCTDVWSILVTASLPGNYWRKSNRPKWIRNCCRARGPAAGACHARPGARQSQAGAGQCATG